MNGSAQPVSALAPGFESLARDLYQKSHAANFGLDHQDFVGILAEVGAKYLKAGSGPGEARELYSSLRVEELALARACAAGHEKAWETFLLRYREKLYDMALGVARESSAARDLADSLYADLYGMTSREGRRVSKLSFYTGRGSLEGWLRTVLTQEYVNRYRRQRRFVSLDEESEEGRQFAAPHPQPVAPVEVRLEAATDEALGALSAEDRFILASYHLDKRTLADIARTLGVHESTISRRLDKLTMSLRKAILGGLARRGMDRRQAEEALAVDVRDLGLDVSGKLAQESADSAFSRKSVRTQPTDGSG